MIIMDPQNSLGNQHVSNSLVGLSTFTKEYIDAVEKNMNKNPIRTLEHSTALNIALYVVKPDISLMIAQSWTIFHSSRNITSVGKCSLPKCTNNKPNNHMKTTKISYKLNMWKWRKNWMLLGRKLSILALMTKSMFHINQIFNGGSSNL